MTRFLAVFHDKSVCGTVSLCADLLILCCLLIAGSSSLASNWITLEQKPTDHYSPSFMSYWDKDSLVLNKENQWAYLWMKRHEKHSRISVDGGVFYQERLRYIVISCATKEEAILQEIYFSEHGDELFRKSYDQAEFSIIHPGSDVMLISKMVCPEPGSPSVPTQTNPLPVQTSSAPSPQELNESKEKKLDKTPSLEKSEYTEDNHPKSLEELIKESEGKHTLTGLMGKALGDSFNDLFNDYLSKARSWFFSGHDQKIQSLIDEAYRKSPWGYTGYTSPVYWHRLSESYKACSSDRNQSPIPITQYILSALTQLDFMYQDISPLVKFDPRRFLRIEVHSAGMLRLGGYDFELKEMEFHQPAEHMILGKRYPLSIHLLHRDKNGHTVIIAIPIDEGPEDNHFIMRLLDYFPLTLEAFSYPMSISLNPKNLLPVSKQYFTYSGSLTIPPCSDGVLWIVFKNPLLISASQMKVLQQVVPHNARPLQSVGARLIKLSH